MEFINDASVPSIPLTGNLLDMTFTPSWVVSLCIRALNGWNAGKEGNGISCDSNGDLVLYRRLNDEDYVSLPEMKHIKEIWLTYEFPDTSKAH